MPKGGLSYKSYASCVRDAAANGVSAGPCKELATGSGEGMPGSPGNTLGGNQQGNWNLTPQPQPQSIKGYSQTIPITPQPDPRLPQGNQTMSQNPQDVRNIRQPRMRRPNQMMSGQGGMNTQRPGKLRPGGQNIPITPGRPGLGRNPGMQNQVMSGQSPATMAPRNVVAPPAQAGPRPLRKRRGNPPNPAPMPSNFKGHY